MRTLWYLLILPLLIITLGMGVVALVPTGSAHAAPAIEPANLPACTYEDGSGQALCMWDAQTMGNGMGADVVAGDCSTGTVGDSLTSAWCLALWDQPYSITYRADGSVSEMSEGRVLVDDCLTIEYEARNDNTIREQLNGDGWNLAECFKAHIE